MAKPSQRDTIQGQKGPVPKAPPAMPAGRKLARNLGPGTLYPGVGRLVQRTGEPQYCGTISGLVFGYTEHANTRDPARTSTRFVGQFIAVDREGAVSQGYECYLPGTVERALKAALRLRGAEGEPVPVATEIWCEPDEQGRPASPLGYSYVVYDRLAQRANDPVLSIAYDAGILERPASSPAAIGHDANAGRRIDPETGEVLPDTAEAAD